MPVSGAAGLGLAALAWLVIGSAGGASAQLDTLDKRLAADHAPSAPTIHAGAAALVATSTPIFALTTGPGAVADTAVQLSGVEISSKEKAALLAIGGQPADWLELGATRGGVTLMEIRADKAVVDTAVGLKEVALGATAAPASGASTPAPNAALPALNVVAAGSNAIPPGTRLPPPPASAPHFH